MQVIQARNDSVLSWGGIGKDGAGEPDVKYTEVLKYKGLVTDGVGVRKRAELGI